MKKIFWIFIAALALFSCSKNDNFKVHGIITNSQSDVIYLDKLEISGSTPFDSSKVDKNGKFKFAGQVSHPTFFLLRLGQQKFITLLLDSLEDVEFSADYLNFTSDYKVIGSQGSLQVQELTKHLRSTNNTLDSLQLILNINEGKAGYNELKSNIVKEIQAAVKNQQDFSTSFVNDNPFSMASVLAIYQKFNSGNYIIQDIQTLKVAASALYSAYPKSTHANTLYHDIEKLVRDIKNQELTAFIQEHGKNLPEIDLPNINGKNVALSSLEGKVVLLQFWSAHDKNCRVLNNILRENYREFKSKGFEIYQVSVDSDREIWEKAIAEDQLTWINVGDMRGSNSAIFSFNVRSLPTNYLINQDGTIVARDLIGPEIHKKLSELLN